MSFFGFNQEDIIPYSETNASKRNARVANNMANLKEEMDMLKDYEASSNKIKKEMMFEESAKTLVNSSSIERRKRNHEEGVLKESVMRQTLVAFLTETVLKGLVFDEDFYYSQESYLKEELNSFFNKAFDDNVISDNSFIRCESMLMEDLYFHLKDSVNKKVDNRTEVDIFNEDTILEMLAEDDTAQKISDEIAKIVKEKVMDTLESEKRIATKKDDEKKEFAQAADSLDKDVEDGDPEQASDDDTDGDFENDEDPSDEELDNDEKEADDDSEGDDEDEDIDLDSEDEDDNEDIDTSDTEASDDLSQDTSSVSTNNSGDSVTITANGVNITVSANKSESIDYLNLMGAGRFKEKNSKSLFRNLMENVLTSSVKTLTESSSVDDSVINMDFVLAETITQYTILETLYTSKLINPSTNQINNFKKSMNFR